VEIVPVRPGGPSIEPILQDYRQRYALSESMVLQALVAALATRRAQALIAVEAGRPVGAVVLSRQGGQGQIHLLHFLPEAAQARSALLERAESELAQEGGLASIQASLARFPEMELGEVFVGRGYTAVPRARMVLDLAGFAQDVLLPAEYRLVPWQAERLDEATRLVHAAHQALEDRTVFPEWSGLEGARHLLEQATGGTFGRFDPVLSPMLLVGGELAGLCLSLWHVALPNQGFIADLCVEEAQRGRGLGRALAVASARAFREAGAGVLGLAVTLSNQPALHLYESLDFRVEQYFDVFRREVGL